MVETSNAWGDESPPLHLNKGDNMENNNFIVYRLKQISLEPDKYGKHLKIKMVSMYDGHGKFIKNVKIDDDMLKTLSESWIMPNEPVRQESL